MERSKTIMLKKWDVSKMFYRWRELKFVLKTKESYAKTAVGIWWSTHKGIGIKDRPEYIIKYTMIGGYFFKWIYWFEFKWLGINDYKRGR
jgi:hypothetical protein